MNIFKKEWEGYDISWGDILNIFTIIIGTVWLLVLGEWRIVLIGIIGSIIMPVVYSLIMFPAQLFMAPAISYSEKGKKIPTMIFVFLSGIYSNFIMLLWVNVVFSVCVTQMFEQGVSKIIPLLIFANAVTMAPLLYMARREKEDSKGTVLGLNVAFIGFIIWTVLWFLGSLLTGLHSLIFWMLIIIASIISCRQVIKIMNDKKEEERENCKEVLLEDQDTEENNSDSIQNQEEEPKDNIPEEDLWQEFEGLKNTDDVLILKAKKLAPLVSFLSAEGTDNLFKELRNSTEYGIDDKKGNEVFFETSLFYLHFIDRMAFQYLNVKQRELFVDDLFSEVREKMANSCENKIETITDFFFFYSDTYNERQKEYGKYKMFPEKEEGMKDTLFWEFEKKIAGILQSESDIILITSIHTYLVVPLIDVLNIPKLLKEE